MNPTDKPHERVAIAVVEHQGRYLVGTAPPRPTTRGPCGIPWRTVSAGRRGSACAVRECLEETGLAVTAVRRLCEVCHTYAHGAVELEFWLCRLGQGESPQRLRAALSGCRQSR